MEKLVLIKVGGKIVEEEETLRQLLNDFAAIEGYKVLVHGGGRSATKLAAQLGIESKMVNGRRITDAETLKVVTMVYGGLVNKNIVAGLQALGVTDVFDEERADFSPLSDDGGCLTRIQHAARVMVDEEGCTAAAFTVELKDGSMMPKDPPRVDFHLDRPFLFYITGDTGNVLFSGVVEQPQ